MIIPSVLIGALYQDSRPKSTEVLLKICNLRLLGLKVLESIFHLGELLGRTAERLDRDGLAAREVDVDPIA